MPATETRRPDASAVSEARFLEGVGHRVRELRAQRGFSRRETAERAGVSERYLAQLEGGEGNASIGFLRRVALALDVGVAALLQEEASTDDAQIARRVLEFVPRHRLGEALDVWKRSLGAPVRSRTDRIALVGLRGAGKSTLGAGLARSREVPFVELDREIEQDAGATAAEIFNLYGPAGYRRIELRSLERVLGSLPRAVIATSGGIVSEPDTYDRLLQQCFTVWLHATPEEHMARVVAQGDLRPMAGKAEAMDDLRRILAAREALYRRADAVIDTSGQTAESALAALCRAVPAGQTEPSSSP